VMGHQAHQTTRRSGAAQVDRAFDVVDKELVADSSIVGKNDLSTFKHFEAAECFVVR